MSTPVLVHQVDAELHERSLHQEAERERLAQLASQQRAGSTILDSVLSGLGDLLISLGKRLKEQHPVDPVPYWYLAGNTQTDTRIIKM